jgi:hypothetical protein
VKEIQLTKGQVAIVDDEDYEWLNQYKWHALWNPHTQTYYAVCTEYLGGGRRNPKRRTLRMHRVILGLEHGDPRTGDHVETGQTLDNRRENLRVSKHKWQQTANQRTQRNHSVGLKGVSRSGSKYMARIEMAGKRKYLGTRDTKEAAHELYVQAAQEQFGEYARVA